MTVDEIIKLAREAGGYDGFTSPPTDWDEGDFVISPEQLSKFATLVRTAALEALKAENGALRAEVERLRSMTAMTMGVGSGDGNLFVHGDYESIKAAQAIVLERSALRAEVERDKALLRQALMALEEASDALHKGHPVRVNTHGTIAALRERLWMKEQT